MRITPTLQRTISPILNVDIYILVSFPGGGWRDLAAPKSFLLITSSFRCTIFSDMVCCLPIRMVCRDFILPEFCKPCPSILGNLFYLAPFRKVRIWQFPAQLKWQVLGVHRCSHYGPGLYRKLRRCLHFAGNIAIHISDL